MRTISLTIVIILSISGCTTKQATATDAAELFKLHKYEQSIALLKELSKAGDPVAQFDLANLYALGLHLPADQVMAEKLWGMSCQQKFYSACTNIGQRYLHNKNYEKAETVLLEAASHGNILAAEYLGKLYGNQSWSGASEIKAQYWSDESKNK